MKAIFRVVMITACSVFATYSQAATVTADEQAAILEATTACSGLDDVEQCAAKSESAAALLFTKFKSGIANLEGQKCDSTAWELGTDGAWGIGMLAKNLPTARKSILSARRVGMMHEVLADRYLADINLTAGKLTGVAAEMMLVTGNTAIQRRCLDKAEFYFRQLIGAYSAPEHAGYRDRALLGLSDVRDKRSWRCMILGGC
jgi:hypothetical protein